jgi:energy-coupling factor transporter ATP-binding protein EcfA2
MCFVGREKETKKIMKALERGNNVVLMGKYGIGRTSLIKHVAALMKDRWRFVFVDFSQTPGKVTTQLLGELVPEKRRGKDHYIRYKSGRFLIVSKELKDKRKHVLVFDNIAKLTAQKLQLIRYLIQESTFQYIAIAESFLSKEDLFLLRAALLPAEMIMLPYLSEESTKTLLCHLADKYSFHWSEQRLSMLVSATRGYPLGVHEVIKRELDMRKKDGFRQ